MSSTKNVEMSTPASKSRSNKLCVYQLYANCNGRCNFHHRKGMVFNERTTKFREYIRAQKICVAYMLFGKCSHKRKNNAKHLNISTVRRNFDETRVEQKPVPTDYALAEKNKEYQQENMALTLKISELEEKLAAYKNTIVLLTNGLDLLHESIAPSASMSVQTQTDDLPKNNHPLYNSPDKEFGWETSTDPIVQPYNPAHLDYDSDDPCDSEFWRYSNRLFMQREVTARNEFLDYARGGYGYSGDESD